MEAKTYTISNKTRETSVGSGVTVVNSAREPLMALRVMVEGLGSGEEAGLWLTQVTVLPMVPRIAPFDLVYLDADHQVVERVELLPSAEMPRFNKPASSALVLPFGTIASAQIEIGDQLAIEEAAELEPASASVAPEPEVQAKPESVAPATNSDELTILEAPPPISEFPTTEFDSPFLNPFSATESEPVEPPQPSVDGKRNGELGGEFVLADFLRKEPVASEPPSQDAAGEPKKTAAEEETQVAMRSARKRHAAPVPIDWASQQYEAQKPESGKPVPAEKKPAVGRFFRWLYPALYEQNRRGAERKNSEGLAAYDFFGDHPRMHEVHDISSDGLYLRTQQRWEPGTLISLTLQPGGPFEVESTLRVEFDCRVARIGADGMGLTFALPPGMKLKLWEAPGRNGADESDPMSMVRELRMARALAFLRQICPPADAEVTDLLHRTLSNVRAANLVEVALKAERLLAQEPDAYSMAANRDLILRILEQGSWVDLEWLQELWAGLLATSCTFEGQDESNLVYVNLLSKLSPLPMQILTMACAKAMLGMTESAEALPARLACSADEIARMTRSNNLVKIYKSIGELSELGLVEKNPRSASPANPGAAKAMPTQLGLEMFARCNGQRGATMAA